MQQDLFLQRDELAQAHQLGEFQREYTIWRVGKLIVGWGILLIIGSILLFTRIASTGGITVAIFWVIVYAVLISTLLGWARYYVRRLHVYVYTDGLIYLKGNKRRAVRWEQVARVSNLFRGAFSIYVKDEPRIDFPSLIYQSRELYSTIMHEVESHSRSGDQPALPTPAAMANEPSMTLSGPGQLFERSLSMNAETNEPSVTPSGSGQPTFSGAQQPAQQPTTSPSEQFGFEPPVPDYLGQQAGPNAEQSPTQSGYTSTQYNQGTMPASQFNVQPPYAAAPQPPTRRRLWIIWGAIGIGALVLIAGLVVFGVIAFMNLPTPTSTLNAFCSALKSGDYQTAYNQFSSALQSQIAEVQFAALYDPNLGLGKVTNCTVSNVNNAAGSGMINTTFASGNTLVFDYALVNQSGTWKINGYRARSSPTLTLLIFCYALKSQNYPAAYNQLSSSQQRQQSEAQFANLFIRDTVTTCMVSNVNDTAGTGSITRTYANGSSNTFDYTLIVEHGTWKINTRHLRP